MHGTFTTSKHTYILNKDREANKLTDKGIKTSELTTDNGQQRTAGLENLPQNLERQTEKDQRRVTRENKEPLVCNEPMDR